MTVPNYSLKIPENTLTELKEQRQKTNNRNRNLLLFLKGTDSVERLLGLLGVVVVVRQIVGNSLSILHHRAED